MEPHHKHPPTHLFAIRVWSEKLETGKHEWRGKVQNVTSGEGYYFRGWQALVELLQTQLPELGKDDQDNCK
jgi:hypothetical protein